PRQLSVPRPDMDGDRLKILFLAPFAPSPATFGAQRRAEGLMAALGGRHEITAVSVIPDDQDARAAERAMAEYCSEVVLIARPSASWEGVGKRFLQVCSLLSSRSLVRGLYDLRSVRDVLHRVLSARAYDVVNVELPFLAFHELAKAPPGARPPRLVLDEHNIEFDLARQQASRGMDPARRIYNAINWRKVRREEMQIWSRFDGVAFCSAADQARARALVPSLRSAVVPNAVNVEYFKPGATDPPSDGRTVLFFGALDYFPNQDGVLHFLREAWPLVEKSNPAARLKIVGQEPTPQILAHRGPRVEIAGKVDDVRQHLASAAVSIAPLRIGGGTRFKILEAMAMAKPVVSTSLGAEGIDAEAGRHLLLGDDPASLAAAVLRVLGDPQLASRLGREGRALVEERYSWHGAARALEELYGEVLAAPQRAELTGSPA
ncbi:MAG: glycosyltransferase family 4 protein, partial [Myxococcales bacterium]